MAVNKYFNHVAASNEQNLYHDLATEMVQLSGIDVHYIKSEQVIDENYDELFGENRFENLNHSTVIEMYLKDFEQPLGNDDLYAKFGIHQPNTATFVVGVRRFNEVLGHRPREGDYIYIPLWDFLGPDDIFRITKVDSFDIQWQALGSPVYYFVKAEKAKFSHQELNTGIAELDSTNWTHVNDDSVENDPNTDNEAVETMNDFFINFDENHPFGRP